jgi:thioredoxin 1
MIINLEGINKFDLNNDKLSIICFTAKWCGPCNHVKPILDEISEEYKDIADVYTVDVDVNKKFVDETFRIPIVPTFYFVKNETLHNLNEGSLVKEQIIEIISNIEKDGTSTTK